MFEIFLFVNPIGVYCYDTEVLIKNAIDELNIESFFHFIPITNSKVIKEDIIRRKAKGQIINDIPEYTMASYQTLRNYHAIKFLYGNRKARYYLVNLQKAISGDFNVYSQDLPEQVALDLGINYNRINNSKFSKYLDDSIQKDKEIARNYNVKNIPTTIIFNENGNYTGILLEGIIAHDKLITLFKNSACSQIPEKENNFYSTRHLRLM